MRMWSHEEHNEALSRRARECSVRMVFEKRDEHPSLLAAIQSITAKIGCSAQTLQTWVAPQTEHEAGGGMG